MKYKPLGNRVLIKMQKTAEKTDSGLYLNQAWEDLDYVGEIVAVGPDAKLGAKVGDNVVYSRAAAIDFGDKELRFVFDSQVALVCE